MHVSEMRKILSKKYGPSWAARVEKMSDAKVAAIYMRTINKENKK